MLHEDKYDTESLWQAVVNEEDPQKRKRLINKLRSQIKEELDEASSVADLSASEPEEDLVRYVAYMYRAERISLDNDFKITDEEIANLKLGGWNLLKFIARHSDFDVRSIADEMCEKYDLDKEEYLDGFFTKPSHS